MCHRLPLWLILCAVPASCFDVVYGSGVSKTEARPVEEFHAVRLEGFGNLLLKVGEPAALVITGDDNLVAMVKTRVEQGTLVIGIEQDVSKSRGKLEFAVSTPRLDALQMRGAGAADVQGLTGAAFDARLSGAGSLVATGAVDHLTLQLSGAGAARLYALKAKAADLSLAGVGSAQVSVSEHLKVRLSGVGSVTYRGDPKVEQEIGGIGRIARDDGR